MGWRQQKGPSDATDTVAATHSTDPGMSGISFSYKKKGEAMAEEERQQRLKGWQDYRRAHRTCAL
jgi:hypothetical protein